MTPSQTAAAVAIAERIRPGAARISPDDCRALLVAGILPADPARYSAGLSVADTLQLARLPADALDRAAGRLRLSVTARDALRRYIEASVTALFARRQRFDAAALLDFFDSLPELPESGRGRSIRDAIERVRDAAATAAESRSLALADLLAAAPWLTPASALSLAQARAADVLIPAAERSLASSVHDSHVAHNRSRIKGLRMLLNDG